MLRLHTVLILLVLSFSGCRDKSTPNLEIEQAPDAESIRYYDSVLCAPTPGLSAETVVGKGYGVAMPVSEAAERRYTECPLPLWASEAPNCPVAGETAPWAEATNKKDAEIALMRQAWCWHGVDLSKDSSVECSDPFIYPIPRGNIVGDFECVVTYQGESADSGAFLVSE
ncbi:hypothetical protein KKF91_03025 [Myxococcota bacterium]|nr:hypothetical protein [Myxococcota bacterium]